ncbi:hypothetical protein V6C27_12255 [Peptococcaceae bacterium 1198_IL3148]
MPWFDVCLSVEIDVTFKNPSPVAPLTFGIVSQTELKLIRLSLAGSLANSPSLAQLPVAHVLCATLPPTAFFAKFGSLLNYMSFATAAGAGFFNQPLF